ncbi:MAG: tRNA dihydrouridine(20/20a) synthase DusA [Gammaproteobacteria bacterium]|nr:tRNA dihydrouridine(20/20a) synthase DusA [Gammaproteobacteria bacterium]
MAREQSFSRVISIAPMLDWTDRHDRYFLRLISRHTLLYTEMVTTGAILFGDKRRHLDFDPSEQPLAIQLGGSEPKALAECAKIAEQWGYREINFNVGCPSDRVQSGKFGACLMAEPELVRDCLEAMIDAVSIPVSVKTRIGIDRQDSFDELHHFVSTVMQSGCGIFIIHARKAWLDGLSPKQNREIPPLRYDRVYKIKQLFPELEVIINGGIKTLEDCKQHLKFVDGVMIGREAYQNPYLLVDFDEVFFQDNHPKPEREVIITALLPYIESHLKQGGKLQQISRHLLGLFQSVSGAKYWRRAISENAHLEGAGTEVITSALDAVQLVKKTNHS